MGQYNKELEELRAQMTIVNEEIMHSLNKFFTISSKIGEIKDKTGLPHFDPVRESDMLIDIQLKNRGPAPQDLLKRIFREILKASVEDMGIGTRKKLMVNRLPDSKDLIIDVNGIKIGGEKSVLIAGPCAVEIGRAHV